MAENLRGVPKPTIGRIVIFTSNGLEFPAIVTSGRSGVEPEDHTCDLTIFGGNAPLDLAEGVQYSHPGAHGTWRWPARV
jgi:hypothetical protein